MYLGTIANEEADATTYKEFIRTDAIGNVTSNASVMNPSSSNPTELDRGLHRIMRLNDKYRLESKSASTPEYYKLNDVEYTISQ